MFKTIFVETGVKDLPKTGEILARFKNSKVEYIDNYEQIWGRVKKPYLHKRTDLNLFLARKKGQLVKEAPNAYGVSGERHYYFIHAFNCVYECEYCYLQGYFNTPDIALFLNHGEIKQEMGSVLERHPGESVWFHAGEFSDSLALSHISGELEAYWDFFQKNPRAKLELRTKSVNIKRLENLAPLPNAYASFSLSPEKPAREIELKTPPLRARLKAIGGLLDKGHQIGIHFDPVVYQEDVFEQYADLFGQLSSVAPLKRFAYFSLGVARFTPDVYRQARTNYPESQMFAREFVKTSGDMIRYARPMRSWILNKLKDGLVKAGAPAENVYLCMEDD